MTDLRPYLRGSVRSLKPGVMTDIRKMFDNNTQQDDKQSPTHRPRPALRVPQPAKPPPRPKVSPTRANKPNNSPVRRNQSPGKTQKNPLSPTPPRKKVEVPQRPTTGPAAKVSPKISVTDVDKDYSKSPANRNNEQNTETVTNRVSQLVGRLQIAESGVKNLGPVKDQNISDSELSKLLDKDGIPRVLQSTRPISVHQRTQLFEPGSNVSSSPPRPTKPPPPVRQRSKSNSADYQHIDLDDPTVLQCQGKSQVTAVKSSPIPPPTPPKKPPRNFRHDDYMKVKVGNQVQVKDDKETDLTDSYEEVDIPVYRKISRTLSVDSEKEKRSSVKKPVRPRRPPPPRKNQRPFSIATDTVSFSQSEGSDSDDRSKPEDSFYESLSVGTDSSQDLNDPIKHWDLPRMTHPEPIRRSLSDDCIHRAVDNEGNIVYVDPKTISREDTGYDIYIDSAGYAVPHKLMKRKNSSGDTESSRPVKDRVKSKFRRFKNLFNEHEKKPSSQADNRPRFSRTSQKKMAEQVKEKVNEAFAPVTEVQTEAEEELDVKVAETEIRKRVAYSRSVRLKTGATIRESRKKSEKIYPQLFEHAMIISLKKSPESGEYEPYVRYKFPEIGESNVSVPQFCFPDAANFKVSSSSATRSQSYSFVLTNIDGGRVYGYCRRFVPPNSIGKVPEVICIISPVDAFMLYNSLLQEIEKRRVISLDLAQEVIAAAFGRPLPAPGKAATVKTLDIEGEMETVFLHREIDSRVENVNCECLLSALSVDKLLKVFASILLERSVLFSAKHLSILSSTIHALTSLLYPFSWQHTYIPVLPSAMLDVVCSPTPYIIGITAQKLQDALTLPLDENVMVVDLDTKKLVRVQGDEGTLLPSKLEKALKKLLNMCKFDPESSNLMISEGFLRFFIASVGHYGQYIQTRPGGEKWFDKEEFIKGAPCSSMDELLTWFVETQMFEVFMTSQLEKKDWRDTIEYFQKRIKDYKVHAGKIRRQAAKKAE